MTGDFEKIAARAAPAIFVFNHRNNFDAFFVGALVRTDLAAALQKAGGGRGVLLGGVPGVLPGHVLIIGGGVVGNEDRIDREGDVGQLDDGDG